jgi:hypothetical protein
MSLIPVYVCEKDVELPDDDNYFAIARNGIFMQNNAGVVKGLVRLGTETMPEFTEIPNLQDFKEEKPALPIYLYEVDAELPSEPCYLIAKNGAFQYDPNAIKKSLPVNLSDIINLAELKTHVRLQLQKLPAEIIYRCLLFFRLVYSKYHSESCLILYYHAEKKQYYLRCPKQRVTHGSVVYGSKSDGTFYGAAEQDQEEILFQSQMFKDGYAKVGTIHSHCDFSAFHSGIDTADEARFDGVHVTIGHVNSNFFSFVVSLVVYGNRFKIEQNDMSDITTALLYQHGEHYDINLTKDEQAKIKEEYKDEIEKEWFSRVDKPYIQPTYPFKKGKSKKKGKTGRLFSGWDVFAESGYGDGFADDGRDDFTDESNFHVSAVTAPSANKPMENVDYVRPECVKEVAEEQSENFLRRVRSHATALRNHGKSIPKERYHLLLNTLRYFFGRDCICDDDITFASNIDPKTPSEYKGIYKIK